MLGHLIEQWRKVGTEQIGVVCADGDSGIQAELERLGVGGESRIVNPRPERGMFSSIQCAARWEGWKAGLTHWAIVLGDQPHLSLETLSTIIDFSAANPDRVCQLRSDYVEQRLSEAVGSWAGPCAGGRDQFPAAICTCNDAHECRVSCSLIQCTLC